jgi:hypothetical protein
MSIPGLKSIEEHQTVNTIIIDLLKEIIPNIQINHSRIISGRFFYNCGFKVDFKTDSAVFLTGSEFITEVVLVNAGLCILLGIYFIFLHNITEINEC